MKIALKGYIMAWLVWPFVILSFCIYALFAFLYDKVRGESDEED